MRPADPAAAAARSSRPAGCRSSRGRPRACRTSRSAASPTPTACSAAIRAGADAIGLNLVPGTPRALTLEEAATARADARAAAAGATAARASSPSPWIARRASSPAIVRAVEPDVVQLNGDEPPALAAARSARPVWKAPPRARGCGCRRDRAPIVERARPALGGRRERDAARRRRRTASGGNGTRIAGGLAAAVAREVPVTLAGGLRAANVGRGARAAIPAAASTSRRASRARASPAGDRARTRSGSRCSSKRARARTRRPPERPARPDAGPCRACSTPTRAGRWGIERDFGGRYVPETLMAGPRAARAAYDEMRQDPRFWAELRELLAHYVGRPTPLYRADRLAEAVDARRAPARRRDRGLPDIRASASTSSAKTSPTPARTRSTTRSARRC